MAAVAAPQDAYLRFQHSATSLQGFAAYRAHRRGLPARASGHSPGQRCQV